MSRLEGQLDGMGVAFASSLLGLAGSLVVGLLELFASHGQNRFFRELEEWVSTITRVGFSSGDGESSGEVAALGPVLELLQGQLDAMQLQSGQSVEVGAALDARIERLAGVVEALAERVSAARGPDAVLSRIAEGQDRMVALMEQGATGPELARIADGQAQLVAHLAERARSPELEQIAEGQARMVALMEETAGGTLDAESRMHLRSIDTQLLRLLEDIAAGRQEAVDDLRSELAQLSRLVRQMSVGRRQEAPTPIVGRRS
jgi:hypothetical protein